jgi:molybdenum cofactor cytidylyltransferase
LRVVVLGAFSELIQKELEGADLTITMNRHYQRGQLSSILKGIEVARSLSPAGILIQPVDHPFTSAGLVKSLITHFNTGKFLIVLPRFGGRRGHPVLLSSELFVDIMNAPPDLGARAVVWQHQAETCEVHTDDRGCVVDIDTPEDYSRYFSNIHQIHQSSGSPCFDG